MVASRSGMGERSGRIRFGAYLLGESLGGGGLGEVFAAALAEDAPRPPGAPEGRVAVKRLYAEHLPRPELVAHFAAECDCALRVRHPHLVRGFDRGEVDGVPYLAMAHAGDANLASAPLPRERVAEAATALAAALDHLHAAGFVHADVSPRNVVVGGGAVTLVDFGSATSVGQVQARPSGTYAYMAPEQARGQALTGAADQFALAALLWEQLAGRRLFWRAAPHLTLVAVVEDAAPPLGDPALAAADAVLARGLAKDPRDRYPSCADLAAALADALP